QPTTAITQSRYFLITMTNYPNVLLRTQQYQEPPIQIIILIEQRHSWIHRTRVLMNTNDGLNYTFYWFSNDIV
ncbi:unnamed protein product, partial [Rotaria magnacalcarata]